MQERFGVQPLSAGEIRKVVKQGFFNQTLGSKIDGVKSSVSDIQNIVEDFAKGVDDQQTVRQNPTVTAQRCKPSCPVAEHSAALLPYNAQDEEVEGDTESKCP